MFHVYVLLLSNHSLYKGSTNDLRRRIAEHQHGQVSSTKNHRPVKLIHEESYLKKSDASRREMFLKTTEGRRLLRQQIRDILKELNLNA